MSFNYSSSQMPIPVVPTAPPLQSSCTDTTTTAATFNPITTGSDPFAENINKSYAQMAAAFGYGAGSYAVMDGMTLSVPGSGLNLPVAAGHYTCMGVLEYGGGTVLCPDNTALVFVWGLQDNSLTTTITIAPPAPNCVYIGNCTTSAGNIVAVDYSAVCYCQGGMIQRTVNDRSAPVDTPSAGTAFLTQTQSGTFHWNGLAYNSLTPTSAGALNIKQTLTGDFTTISQDNFHNVCLDPNGSNRVIYLPNPASVGNAWRISYTHIGSANTLVVKDYTGVTTYGTLTTTNRSLAVFTYTNSSGVVAFPAAPYVPGPIPTPTAGAAI